MNARIVELAGKWKLQYSAFDKSAGAMSNLEMSTNPAKDSLLSDNSIDTANLSAIVEITDSTASASDSDNLIKQCENRLKNNVDKYEKYMKHLEDLRLQFIKTNEDFKYLRSRLEIAGADCLDMKSNQDHLTKLYDMLMKSTVVKKIVEGTREKLLLKFFKLLSLSKDMKTNLSAVENNVSTLKLEYDELSKQCNVFLLITSNEESHEFVIRQKDFRLKSIGVIYACERLESSLDEASEKMINLNWEHDDLIQRYQELLQNTFFKEFISISKSLESAENCDKKECLESSRIEKTASANSSELEKQLITEQQRRQEIEKEYNSLNDFTDKICRLFLKHQPPMLPLKLAEMCTMNNPSNQTEIYSEPPLFDTNTIDDFVSSSIISELGVNGTEMELCGGLDLSVFEKGVCSPITQKEERTSSKSPKSSKRNSKRVAKNHIKKGVTNRIKKNDSPVQGKSSTDEISEPFASLVSKCSVKLIRCDSFCNIFFAAKETLFDRSKRTSLPGSSPKRRPRLAFSDCRCDVCGRYLKNKNSLSAHKRLVHEGYKPYGCCICGKMFGHKQNLSRHELTHTSLRPYKCSFCDNSYNDSSTMMKHERYCQNNPNVLKNPPVKPRRAIYCCAHCSERFYRKQDLFDHVNSTKHFSESLDAFKCTKCAMVFSSKVLLKKHCKAQHSKKR